MTAPRGYTAPQRIAAQWSELRPSGGFDLILADPAWHFSLRSSAGETKSPQAHYDTLSLEEIAALPVGSLASKNCALVLWATGPMVPQALEVMRAWGFDYVTYGTWLKRGVRGGEMMGPGYVMRTVAEPFFIGKIGRPGGIVAQANTVITHEGQAEQIKPWPINSITIEALRRGHSEKPPEIHHLCENLMPDARRVELFGRHSRPGWKVWGNQAGKLGEQ